MLVSGVERDLEGIWLMNVNVMKRARGVCLVCLLGGMSLMGWFYVYFTDRRGSLKDYLLI